MSTVTVDQITNNVTVNNNPPYNVNVSTPRPSIVETSTPNSSITISPQTGDTVDIVITNPLVQINEISGTTVDVVQGIPISLESVARVALAMDPETLITGSIIRSATEAPTSGFVRWPDGTSGIFTGVESSTIPGAVDSYTITYGNVNTYHQPTVTRDSSGAVINRPAIVVT